ncbi:MAG: hypothetical protein IPN68_09915 [Bacteroidetes bacterium]|nr:hypothetical protein [Bacteroidota bacterium]
MAGFGRSKFGRGPFGRSDTGRDLIVELFPVEYLEPETPEGADPKNNDDNPLLKVLNTYADSVNQARLNVESLPSLIDYETAPSEILLLIGEMLGLGIDRNDPEFLQRSFVGNASQWLQIKGSKRGYQVRGLASGFQVTVQNFWRVNPIYIPFFPLRYRFLFKPANADPSAAEIFHTDQPPGTYAGPPAQEGPEYAKSSYIKLIFEVAEPRRQNFDYNKTLDLVIDKIRDVLAIHHELGSPEFRIFLNMNVLPSIDLLIDETINAAQANVFDRYDVIPADVQDIDFEQPIVSLAIEVTQV